MADENKNPKPESGKNPAGKNQKIDLNENKLPEFKFTPPPPPPPAEKSDTQTNDNKKE